MGTRETKAESLAKQDPVRLAAALLARANQGDPQALAALRVGFEEDPALGDAFGDLASRAEGALVALAAGQNEVVQEAVRRKLEGLKRELAGESPSPLERLLVARITATWLQVSYAEAQYAAALKGDNVSIGRSEYLQRRCERAQRQHLTAIRALAQVRRLLVPMVQLNIAEQQNITQAAGPLGSDVTDQHSPDDAT